MIWLIAGAVLPSLLISCSAGLFMRRYAPRWGLIDAPGERKVHTTPTPLGGGLAIWLGFVVPFVVAHASQSAGYEGWTDLWILLAAATALMLLGLLDDRFGLGWKLRMAVQLAVATAVVFYQDWRLTAFIDWPAATGGLSVLWIVGLVNSFNMLDNMDGLSAGVAAIAAGMLAALMLLTPDAVTHGPQLLVAVLLLALLGSLLGFLWHNRPPARLFMGDAGSYFIGFVLAVATILATFAGGDLPRHAIGAPLCIFAVPLYDAFTVVWIRLRSGRSPFAADTNHFSHRLVALGLSKPQAVLVIYLLTAVCGLAGLLLHEVDTVGAVAIVLLVVFLLALVAVLESSAKRNQRF